MISVCGAHPADLIKQNILHFRWSTSTVAQAGACCSVSASSAYLRFSVFRCVAGNITFDPLCIVCSLGLCCCTWFNSLGLCTLSCTWFGSSGLCTPSCVRFGSSGLCTPSCTWFSSLGLCTPSCTLFSSSGLCTPSCTLFGSSGLCTPSCTWFSSLGLCTQSCTWFTLGLCSCT